MRAAETSRRDETWQCSRDKLGLGQGDMSGHCSLQDASRFSGSLLGSLAVVRVAQDRVSCVSYYLFFTYN